MQKQTTDRFTPTLRKLLSNLQFHNSDTLLEGETSEPVQKLQAQLKENEIETQQAEIAQLTGQQIKLYKIYKKSACKIEKQKTFACLLMSIGEVKSWNLQNLKITWQNLEGGSFLLNTQLKKLKVLELNENNIESLDILSKLETQNLKKLLLTTNRITNLSILRKSTFSGLNSNQKSISTLDISHNFVNQMTGITEWQCSTLQWVLLENSAISINPGYVQNYSFDWTMKAKAKSLRFSIAIKSRVKTFRMLAKLKQKNMK